MLKTYGLHHISALVGDAQTNVDYYTQILGMRLVKQTLNYDDKFTYHLYFSDNKGETPLLTTFPFPTQEKTKVSGGQVMTQILSVNPDKFDEIIQKFDRMGIEYELDLDRLIFKDPDGLRLSIQKKVNNYSQPILDSAEILSVNYLKTLQLFTDILGYEIVDEDDRRIYLKIHDDIGGELILLKENTPMGQIMRGTVHHIAFKVKDDEIEDWRKLLLEKGYFPTEIKDRNYFKSLYFRDKGGVIVELATFGPGITLDEDVEELGETFIIPKHFKEFKDEIFTRLKSIKLKENE